MKQTTQNRANPLKETEGDGSNFLTINGNPRVKFVQPSNQSKCSLQPNSLFDLLFTRLPFLLRRLPQTNITTGCSGFQANQPIVSGLHSKEFVLPMNFNKEFPFLEKTIVNFEILLYLYFY